MQHAGLTNGNTRVILMGMEIVKEITVWNVEHRQPNHTYLLNKKGQIVAYAKWHGEEINILKSRATLDKRYRKFEKSNHSGLSQLIPQFKSEDNTNNIKKDNNVRLFKIKSNKNNNEYIVEYNIITKKTSCSCVGYSYRGKCKHSEHVAKKQQSA
jgi:hypothetical protein